MSSFGTGNRPEPIVVRDAVFAPFLPDLFVLFLIARLRDIADRRTMTNAILAMQQKNERALQVGS
jgi:hypothetical protein